MKRKLPDNVDEYIATFSEDVQGVLEAVRKTIKNTVPEAEETISYGMPAYRYYGMLVYFAAYKNHIGFYATPTGHKKFEKELAHYNQGKGSVQFPLDKPMPIELIEKIVKFRMKENFSKASQKLNPDKIK